MPYIYRYRYMREVSRGSKVIPFFRFILPAWVGLAGRRGDRRGEQSREAAVCRLAEREETLLTKESCPHKCLCSARQQWEVLGIGYRRGTRLPVRHKHWWTDFPAGSRGSFGPGNSIFCVPFWKSPVFISDSLSSQIANCTVYYARINRC